jgi:hypothetical protein
MDPQPSARGAWAAACVVLAGLAVSAPLLATPQTQPAWQQTAIGSQDAEELPRTFYVDPAGDDAQHGTSVAAPWRTLGHAIPQLRHGDTLYMRGGTYFESEIRIEVSGAPGAPITIAAFPGEHPVIDGSYPEFRVAGNEAWELVDPSRQIFRSVGQYPDAGEVYGYFGAREGSWALVPYELQGPFGTVNEAYSETPPYYYIGPGVYWDSADSRIYYRSQLSIYQLADGFTVPLDPDPRQTVLSLFPDDEVLLVEEGVGHIVLDGLDIRNQKTALVLAAGAHHVTVRDCNVRGGRNHILVRDGCHDLTFDGITVLGKFPDWVTWSDVKRPVVGRPGHLLQGAGINLDDSAHRVEITNSTFSGVFDAIGGGAASTNLRVHHNVFDVRDDVLQLGSAGWNIEFDNNAVLRAVSGGPSWSGAGSPPASMAGTVYVHHNVIDTSLPQRYGRWDPQGLLGDKYQGPKGDGYATGRTFGSHSKDEITGPAPWKIYHNTAIVSDDVSNGGAGQAYRADYYDPAVPHEVYNNIFVQLSDEWLLRDARAADGSQIHDGNLYWAPNLLSGTDLFEDIWTGGIKDDFDSLADFVGSGAWAVTKTYYPPGWEASGVQADPQLDELFVPHPDGPAASGAVDLSGKNWPGLKGETFRGALAPPTDSH